MHAGKGVKVAIKGWGIFFTQGRLCFQQGARALRRVLGKCERLREIGTDFRHPRVFLLWKIRPAKRAGVLDPFLRERISLRIVVKAAYCFRQFCVVSPLAHQLQKLCKGGIAFLIKLFHRDVHRLAA